MTTPFISAPNQYAPLLEAARRIWWFGIEQQRMTVRDRAELAAVAMRCDGGDRLSDLVLSHGSAILADAIDTPRSGLPIDLGSAAGSLICDAYRPLIDQAFEHLLCEYLARNREGAA